MAMIERILDEMEALREDRIKGATTRERDYWEEYNMYVRDYTDYEWR